MRGHDGPGFREGERARRIRCYWISLGHIGMHWGFTTGSFGGTLFGSCEQGVPLNRKSRLCTQTKLSFVVRAEVVMPRASHVSEGAPGLTSRPLTSRPEVVNRLSGNPGPLERGKSESPNQNSICGLSQGLEVP